MTRKHFIDIAETLRSLKPEGRSIPQQILWDDMVVEMALLCQRHNYNFDRERFYEVCGRSDNYGRRPKVSTISRR